MRRLAVDDTVLLRWFVDDGHPGVAAARELRRAYEAGELHLVVATGWQVSLLDEVADRLDRAGLAAFAEALGRIGLDVRTPQPATVARWMARGLSAADAITAAVVDDGDLRLVTANPRLATVAAAMVQRLG